MRKERRATHSHDQQPMRRNLAGEPGFEPGLTESESVGLPLTYSPAGAAGAVQSGRLCAASAAL
ncbi:hypothetical protein MPL1032_360030 [Mesorhizobium plurifarium]|uniref:Uncharacterized protein n=1 Tax=Mesorhizobium plurifarium TaxID=69974 RepID=A0A0K2W509_MESPL|nr:hypothetical protein MPL1032_360030 [Mesorhizobium plurifarium]